MVRVALGLEYDGGAFCGWQTQPGACAVQDHLERALVQVHGAPVATVVAGRTDAGVHATAQVVHFDAVNPRPESAWVRGVNTFLPAGVSVLWARPVGEGFHARFGARERAYRYVLLNHPVRPAILAGKVGWLHGGLDVGAMAMAAGHLLGRHDFSAFRAAECQAKSPVRELRRADVARHGDFVTFDFRGNAFLHHQVRNMVGALVWIGLGRRPPDWAAELLASRDRRLGAATFAADGLYLVDVRYDAEWNLPTPGGRVPLIDSL
ncbi:tRNA pseudouridine(38-40) synthase TruA [Parasulfuritortus cantonensis]|uniref:tRNA pseudouridine synthase A n=1 Tax=Parasulfuritortus cantonensis TaxID=2528202 RepID=A0A4R1BML3_9PROT|nr:tRNA pseudouridine(38-40) synthase TruA [Parasulfuritortus cantonensis]TCJ18558.1 tRNA pseudouridine(38-40) synthase TruA [Parasulfuritortus cantonensis]